MSHPVLIRAEKLIRVGDIVGAEAAGEAAHREAERRRPAGAHSGLDGRWTSAGSPGLSSSAASPVIRTFTA